MTTSETTWRRFSKDAKLVTFINVFTVEPAKQQRLMSLLERVTETFGPPRARVLLEPSAGPG